MRPHAGERLLPPFAGSCDAGILERGFEVDPTLLFLLPVTVRAIGPDKGGDPVTKRILSIGAKRSEIPVVCRLRLAGHGL